MCPFVGLSYEDADGIEYHKGEGLTKDENKRLDAYFAKYYGQAFSRDRSIELAQMALDNTMIPKGWQPYNKDYSDRIK